MLFNGFFKKLTALIVFVLTISVPVPKVNAATLTNAGVIFSVDGEMVERVTSGSIETVIDGYLTDDTDILVITALYDGGRLARLSKDSRFFAAGRFTYNTSILCENENQTLKVMLWNSSLKPLCRAFCLEPVRPDENKVLSFEISLEGYNFAGFIDHIKNEITVDIATLINNNGTYVQKSGAPKDTTYYDTIKSLTPNITVSAGATVQNGGAPRDFTNDQQYTVVSSGGKSRTYTVRLIKSIHQRSFDFTRENAYLIVPSTSTYGSNKARHGCPGPTGQTGNGIWLQHGFSYAKDENGDYIMNGSSYIKSDESCGYLEFYTDAGLSKRAMRINKDKTNDYFKFYSAEGGAPANLVNFSTSWLRFKIENITGGGMRIDFGKNRFSLFIEQYENNLYKAFYGSDEEMVLAGVLKKNVWYDIVSVSRDIENNTARGQLFINGVFAKSLDISCKYIYYIADSHVVFDLPAETTGSICLQSWGIDFALGSVPQDIMDAYEAHVKSYDLEVLDWIASLYDNETGGFYYSRSARDHEGFLPDLESTAQAMSFIESVAVGAKDIVATDSLYTDTMRENVVDWVKDMQDPDDGYFYHPQWGKNIGSSRLGRDNGWALAILSRFGESPRYKTAAERLGSSKSLSAAAAGGMTLMSVTFPDCLASEELFEEWLDSLPWETNPWSAGHQISSVSSLIKAAGYADVCAEYIYSKQNLETGLWGSTELHNNDPEKTTGGSMKICGALNTFGYKYRYPEKALNSIVPLLLEDTVPNNVTYLYNLWVTLSSLKSNMGSDMPNEWYTILYEHGAEMIAKTSQRNRVFKKPDGGWSYGRNSSPAKSQGVTVSLGLAEGDVNGTGIAHTGVTSAMRNVMGLKNDVAFFDRSHFENLKTVLQNAPLIEKTALREAQEDFEDCTVGEMPDSSYFSANHVGDGMASLAVVSDGDNKVLKFEKDYSFKKNATVRFATPAALPSSEFECSVDFKFSGSPVDSAFMWVSFGDTAFQMYFKKETATTFSLTPRNQSSNLGSFSKMASLSFGQWNNLKVIYKPGTAQTVDIDVYINNEFVADASYAYFGGGNPDTPPKQYANSITFTYFQNGNGIHYADNYSILCKE